MTGAAGRVTSKRRRNVNTITLPSNHRLFRLAELETAYSLNALTLVMCQPEWSHYLKAKVPCRTGYGKRESWDVISPSNNLPLLCIRRRSRRQLHFQMGGGDRYSLPPPSLEQECQVLLSLIHI